MKPKTSTSNITEYLGCLYWLIIPGALFSLCIDALAWSVATYKLFSPWTVIMAWLTLANVILLLSDRLKTS